MNVGKRFLLTAVAAVGLLCMACPTGDDGETGGNNTPPKETWTVTFDLGYTGGTVPAPIKVEKGKTAGSAFPANPAREDFEFTGWYTGTARYTHQTAVTADITLTAQWDAIYTLTFDLGYDGGTSPAPIKIRTGQAAGILFPPDPQRTDYNFRGWLDGTDTYNAATAITKSATLTADWFHGYQVTFAAVVGGMAEAPSPLLVEWNQSMGSSFPAAPQLPAKFTFDGWYDASGTKYEAATAINSDVTLTGKFTWAADVDRITARNAGNPVFKFTVPADDQFGNYTKITVRFLVNDENKSTAAPAVRLYGSYAAADFTEEADRYWKGPPGSYLMFNGIYNLPDYPAVTGNPVPVKYQWYTLEIPFDGTKFNQSHFDASFPGTVATGDFYFALGLSLGGGSGTAVPVTSYMTDVTLSNADGTRKIVSPGHGFTKPAMIGNDSKDIDDDGMNSTGGNAGDISRK